MTAQAAAEAEAAAAMTAQMAAEADAAAAAEAQAVAEADAAAAAMAQMEAEAAAAAAATAQMEAEAAAAAAATAQMEAEAAAAAAATAQAVAEADAAAAQAAQATAEAEAAEEEAARMAAEAEAAAAVTAQAAAEADAAAAAAAQAVAEALAAAAEEAQTAAEAAAAAATQAQIAAEAAAAAAMEAQMAAEADAAAAMEAQMAAEAEAAAAMEAQMAAEADAAAAMEAQMAAEADAAAAMEAQMAAEADAAAATEAQMAAEADAAAATEAQMAAEADAAAAEEARMAADDALMKAQADLAAAKKDLMDQIAILEDEITDLKNERDILQGNKDLADARTASATAKALLASLVDMDPDAGGDPVATPPADGSDPNPEDFPVFDKRLWTDVDVTTRATPTGTPARVTASSEGDLKVSVTGYTQTGPVPVMDMIDGFRGVELEKGDPANRQLLVYTNIDDATPMPIRDVYFSTKPGDDKPSTYPVARADPDPFASQKTIPWSEVVRDDNIEVVTTTRGTDGGALETTTSFTGTVGGLAGTFSCAGDNDDCTAPTIDPATDLLTGGDANVWSFTPGEPDGDVDVADGDGYLAFGWWLHKTGNANAGEQMNVAVFSQAYGLDERTGAAAAATDRGGLGSVLDGSATYVGGAAGKYAIAHTAEDTTVTTHEGGHFTARATFTANFDADSDGDDADGNDKGGISLRGDIDRFMTRNTAEEYMARDGWSVELRYDQDTTAAGRQSPTALGAVPIEQGGTTGTATATWDNGGALKGSGTWRAMYHGYSGGVVDHTDVPYAITGDFEATVSPMIPLHISKAHSVQPS